MPGILSSHSVLSGRGVLSGKGILSGSGILTRAGGWVDPLAGITFALRLQTHRGDGVPLGLYQDAACTVPATEDGDPVGGWRDELSGSGLVAEQSVSTKRPTLRFAGGIPVLEFDGVDDWLDIGFWGGQQVYSAAIKSNTPNWSTYYSIVDTCDFEINTRWGLFESGDNTWHSNQYFPVAVRYNGVEASSSLTLYPCPDPSAWNVITAKTYPTIPVVRRGIFQLQMDYFGDGRMVSLAIHDGNPAIDSAGVIATENYFASLAP